MTKKSALAWLGPVDVRLVYIALFCAALFAGLSIWVALSPGPLPFDRPVSIAVQSADSPAFSPFNSFVAALGGIVGVEVGAAVIVLTFIFRRAATPLVAFSALYSAIYNGVDFAIKRPRPTGLPHLPGPIGAYSYPSGHSAFFVWLAVLAVVLLARNLPRVWFRIALGVAVALALLGALSRIDVGAHWPSDVLGGLLVGIGWMALSFSFGGLVRRALGDRAVRTRGRSATRTTAPG